MTYDLRTADPPVKWLVTCLLATFGIAYLFGGWMVGLYAGFTPHNVGVTYASPEMSMAMPPGSTVVVEHPMGLAEFATADHHTVDRNLLIQDTHVHVPMYGVIAGALSLVVLGLGLAPPRASLLITLLFAAPWLDFGGMWLTKLASPHFALLTVAGGWAMGLGYTVVAAAAMWRMWRPRPLAGGTP
jgi:hypothetical protein